MYSIFRVHDETLVGAKVASRKVSIMTQSTSKVRDRFLNQSYWRFESECPQEIRRHPDASF